MLNHYRRDPVKKGKGDAVNMPRRQLGLLQKAEEALFKGLLNSEGTQHS